MSATAKRRALRCIVFRSARAKKGGSAKRSADVTYSVPYAAEDRRNAGHCEATRRVQSFWFSPIGRYGTENPFRARQRPGPSLEDLRKPLQHLVLKLHVFRIYLRSV